MIRNNNQLRVAFLTVLGSFLICSVTMQLEALEMSADDTAAAPFPAADDTTTTAPAAPINDRSNLEVETLIVGYGRCAKIIVDAAKFNLFLRIGLTQEAATQQAALRQFDNERFSSEKSRGATDKQAHERSYVPLYADTSEYCDAFRRGQVAI